MGTRLNILRLFRRLFNCVQHFHPNPAAERVNAPLIKKKLSPFEELIAHGNHMIRRLERLAGLSYKELEALPAHQQVAVKEAEAWRKAVEERILSTFGQDTLARHNIVWELYRDEFIAMKETKSLAALTPHGV